MSLVFKDAFWQISGRVVSALAGFFVIKILTPYLGPLRYGDYSTILKYFAIWSALADFGIYVLALHSIGKLKEKMDKEKLYHKFLGFRFFMVVVVYLLAFGISFFIPSYYENSFILHGLVIGMLFSATFMLAGIVQLPLQIYWKMEQVSIALILARVVQILSLSFIIFYLYKNVNFSVISNSSLTAFLLVLMTVLLSGLTQFFYVYFKGKKYLSFKIDFDWSFIKEKLKGNWKYGVSYYLSSFHTLIVLIFLSIIFPTEKGFTYVGIWALALALVEILLIVPSAFGNSIIHKISNYKIEEKKQSLGYFLTFIIWFGFLMLFNFINFKTQIVNLIAGSKYLTNGIYIGSDFILPFLAFVLFLSFIKQVFNYILVSFNKQNKLFIINIVGVIIGFTLGLILIPKYNIYGGIITQIVLEICFVVGILLIAWKNNILPKINWKYIIYSFFIFSLFISIFYFAQFKTGKIGFIIEATIVNIFYLALSYKLIRNIMNKI